MDRNEEIKQAASFYQLTNSIEKFIEGAKWADQHPKEGLVDIEDVCKWLSNNINKYLIARAGGAYYKNSMFEDFRKAALEGKLK